MTDKYLLCLGYRKGFVDAAKCLNLRIVFIVEKLKSGLSEFPTVLVSDLSRIDEVVRAAYSLSLDFCGVVTGHEQAVLSATVLRGVFALPGDESFARGTRFRDKVVQKSSLPPEIPKADFGYVSVLSSGYDQLSARFGDEFVVKPVDGHGSINTRKIRSADSLNDFLQSVEGVSDVKIMAETFVPGNELHVDGIVMDRTVSWCATSRYLGNLMNWSEGCLGGDIVLGGHCPDLEIAASQLAERVLNALDAPDGVFHLELFERPDGQLWFGEVACRLAGGLTPEVLYKTYGVNLYEAAIRLALGMEVGVKESRFEPRDVAGYVFLPWSLDVSEESLRSVAEFEELYYPELNDGRLRSYNHWGHAVASAPNPDELEKVFRQLHSKCVAES